MRNLVLYSMLFISLNLQGQISCDHDTIRIREVIINGKSNYTASSGYKTVLIDSSLISNYNHLTLADLISENSTVYIKSYGPGGIATPSFRGTPAGHTQIAWNGLNINNPMPGQFDLSLIPAGFIDEVKIYYGGGSLEISNGGIGGIINLETKPQWTDNQYIMINPVAGSFGRYSGLVRLKTGNKNFQSSTKAYLQNAENNFRYLNTVKSSQPEWERRENNQVLQKGFVQELYLKTKNNSVLSGRFWYQSMDRNLTVPITVQAINPAEKQYDESFRSMLDYETNRRNTSYKITAALLHDQLNYLNESASVDSRNTSQKIIVKTDINASLSSRTRLKADLENEVSLIKSNNYLQRCTRNMATAGIMSETDLYNRLVARILLRETLLDEKLLAPDFSAAADLRILPHKDYSFKINFSRNSKVPALNDMFWSPGGNPDLKNENACIFEISLDMAEDLSSSLRIKNELTIFKNYINNLIQWHPGENSYWVADNLKKIETSGIESGLSVIYHTSGINALLKATYAFTKAISTDSKDIYDSTEGKQVTYVPVNKLNTYLKVRWDHFFTGFNTYLVSRRFLTADNSQYLPGYTVSDLNFGMLLNSGKTSWEMSFSVENLFNTSYQNIAWYPMPGRSYTLSIVILLSRQK